jgi:hypothetical protein
VANSSPVREEEVSKIGSLAMCCFETLFAARPAMGGSFAPDFAPRSSQGTIAPSRLSLNNPLPVQNLRKRCALFCAHPTSKTIAFGSNGAGQQILSTRAENQHHSKSSYLVGKASAATVNRRVASSNLARGAILPAFSCNASTETYPESRFVQADARRYSSSNSTAFTCA